MTEVAIITDSSSQIRDPLAGRLGIQVVPLTVTIDGRDFLDCESSQSSDGLGVDDFYRRFVDGESSVATAQPSPAMFVDAFNREIERGATEVVAVLVGSAYSGTVDSCRMAAAAVDVPVHVVDTGHASFGIGSCAWAASETRSAGGAVSEIVASAEARAADVETVFLLQGLELARRSGRFSSVSDVLEREEVAASSEASIPVLWMGQGEFASLGEVSSLDDASDMMAQRISGTGYPVRVAVSVAHPDTEAFAAALESRLANCVNLVELIRYRVGPSVAAHSGIGSAGAYYWRA